MVALRHLSLVLILFQECVIRVWSSTTNANNAGHFSYHSFRLHLCLMQIGNIGLIAIANVSYCLTNVFRYVISFDYRYFCVICTLPERCSSWCSSIKAYLIYALWYSSGSAHLRHWARLSLVRIMACLSPSPHQAIIWNNVDVREYSEQIMRYESKKSNCHSTNNNQNLLYPK